MKNSIVLLGILLSWLYLKLNAYRKLTSSEEKKDTTRNSSAVLDRISHLEKSIAYLRFDSEAGLNGGSAQGNENRIVSGKPNSLYESTVILAANVSYSRKYRTHYAYSANGPYDRVPVLGALFPGKNQEAAIAYQNQTGVTVYNPFTGEEIYARDRILSTSEVATHPGSQNNSSTKLIHTHENAVIKMGLSLGSHRMYLYSGKYRLWPDLNQRYYFVRFNSDISNTKLYAIKLSDFDQVVVSPNNSAKIILRGLCIGNTYKPLTYIRVFDQEFPTLFRKSYTIKRIPSLSNIVLNERIHDAVYLLVECSDKLYGQKLDLI